MTAKYVLLKPTPWGVLAKQKNGSCGVLGTHILHRNEEGNIPFAATELTHQHAHAPELKIRLPCMFWHRIPTSTPFLRPMLPLPFLPLRRFPVPSRPVRQRAHEEHPRRVSDIADGLASPTMSSALLSAAGLRINRTPRVVSTCYFDDNKVSLNKCRVIEKSNSGTQDPTSFATITRWSCGKFSTRGNLGVDNTLLYPRTYKKF